MDTSGLLDVIAENTSNTEQVVQANSVQAGLNDMLKLMAKREKITREASIMVKLVNGLTFNKIHEFIEINYINVVNKPSASYWQDKEFTYVQFVDKTEKECFLDWVSLNDMANEIKIAIQEPNEDGEHIMRKPIRIMINNVRRIIKADFVESALKRILQNDNSLTNFHEGKANAITGARSIMFNIDSDGFRKLFGGMEGSIPYVNTGTGTKTKLFLKINCKPWTCRDCYAFGMHQCEGKLCGNCGMNSHLTKDCKSKTKFCRNCKRKGHRAKDTHCKLYLTEISKELRKICIPIEYFAEKELRFHLIKHIQIS